MIPRNKGWVLDLACWGCLYDAFDAPRDQEEGEGLQSYSVATSLTRIYAT